MNELSSRIFDGNAYTRCRWRRRPRSKPFTRNRGARWARKPFRADLNALSWELYLTREELLNCFNERLESKVIAAWAFQMIGSREVAESAQSQLYLWIRDLATESEIASIVDVNAFFIEKIRSYIRNVFQKKKREKRKFIPATEDLLDAVHGEGPNPDEGLDAAKLIEVIDAVLGELEKEAPQQARVARMHLLEGMTFPQIAEALNLALSTVTNHFTPAIARLQAAMEKADPDQADNLREGR